MIVDPMPWVKIPAYYDQMTRQERNEARQKYEIKQKGKCYFCKGDLERNPFGIMRKYPITKKEIEAVFPPGFLKFPKHLHHSHTNGMTLGVVHAYCNAVLFVYFFE